MPTGLAHHFNLLSSEHSAQQSHRSQQEPTDGSLAEAKPLLARRNVHGTTLWTSNVETRSFLSTVRTRRSTFKHFSAACFAFHSSGIRISSLIRGRGDVIAKDKEDSYIFDRCSPSSPPPTHASIIATSSFVLQEKLSVRAFSGRNFWMTEHLSDR